MALIRLQDWHLHLNTHIESHKHKEFSWGKWDCAHAAAHAVERLTGVNLMAGIPAYTTEAEATAVIISQCGDPNAKLENLIDKIADAHDMQRLPSTAWAHVGDIVLFESAAGQAVGVVGFKGSHAHIVGTSGLHYVPLSACKCAWALDRGKDYVVHPSFVGAHYQAVSKEDNHE